MGGARHRSRGGRPVSLDKTDYRNQNVIERQYRSSSRAAVTDPVSCPHRTERTGTDRWALLGGTAEVRGR
jgi:hypothetical protein